MARHKKRSTPKLNDKLIEDLALAIRNGAFIETACALCGISKDTLYRWLRDAKREDASPKLLQLSDALLRAMAEDEMRQLAVINRAAFGIPKTYLRDQNEEIVLDELGYPFVTEYLVKPDWKASAYRLSRRDPKRWGNNPEGDDLDIVRHEEDDLEIKIVFVDP